MSDNKITQEFVDRVIEGATTQEFIAFEKVMIVAYKLHNDFVLIGIGGCVDRANFDAQKGRECALQDVKNQLWRLEGYRLYCHLWQTGSIAT